MALAAVFAANFYNGLNTHSWNWWVLGGVLIGPVLITLYTAVYSAFTPGFIWTYVLGNNAYLWPSMYFWLGMLFTIILSLLPRYLYRYYTENYRPSDIDILAYVSKRDPNQCVGSLTLISSAADFDSSSQRLDPRPLHAAGPRRLSLREGGRLRARARRGPDLQHGYRSTGPLAARHVPAGSGLDVAERDARHVDGSGARRIGTRLRVRPGRRHASSSDSSLYLSCVHSSPVREDAANSSFA